MPRAAPPAIERLACERWGEGFLTVPWPVEDRRAAIEKYRAMSAALAEPGGPSHASLRAIASRWPGALREAQITPPELYRARASAVVTQLEPRSRAAWVERGQGAVPLWGDLHGLIADVGRMRSRPADPFAALDPIRRACWPLQPERWPAEVLQRFDTRLALAWLAALAGLDPAELDRVLRR